MRAVIIGSGNVAEAFARALPESGVEVVQIYARNRERGELLAVLADCGWCCEPRGIAEADIYIAAVSDRAITEVLEPLELPSEALVVHVSGGRPLDAIPAKFGRRGVLYPLQTFTAGRGVDFSEIPIFVEGCEPATARRITEVAAMLSRQVFAADSEQRAKIHITGVFACNFVNAMYTAGSDIASWAGVPFAILKPLIAETADKAASCSEPRSVQTGPAVRGDEVTMARHLQLMEQGGCNPLLSDIYRMISEYIRYGKEL